MTGLVSQLKPLVVAAGVEEGHGITADLARVSFGVAEGKWSSERALDQLAILAEHAVEVGVAVDGLAQVVHGLLGDVVDVDAFNVFAITLKTGREKKKK